MSAKCRLAATLLLLLINSTAIVAASTDVAIDDWDEDGVADALDVCPDSDDGDFVSPDGCTICPCEAQLDGTPWGSRRDYFACAIAEVKRARAAGTLRPTEARSAIRRARRTTCGDPELTRCCIYVDEDEEVGRCRIMTEDACDALDDRLFEAGGAADDEDVGSCVPNPCVF